VADAIAVKRNGVGCTGQCGISENDDHGSSTIAAIAYYADDKWPEATGDI